MPKPSEYLISAGWKRTRENCPPRDSQWIDPITGHSMDFVTAVTTQIKRDNPQE